MAKHPDDIHHIKQLQGGDKSALYQLYNKYSGALYGVIIRMCNKESLAQEILQDTFLKIWKQIHTYDPNKGRFYTWAYRIARNTTLNALRKEKDLIQKVSSLLGEDLPFFLGDSLLLGKPSGLPLPDGYSLAFPGQCH